MNKRVTRKRPFLIVKQLVIPAEGAQTGKKNWMADESAYNVVESIEIVDAVQNRHMTEAAVIIDIFQQTTLKNRVNPEDNDLTAKKYIEKYKAQIADGVNIWMKKIAGNEAEAKKIIDAIESDVIIDIEK